MSIALCSSCSFFGPGRETLSVSSEPPGAKVTINGEMVGTTPIQARVSRRRDAAILVTKKGYISQTRVSESRLGTLGILDVIGTFIWLVPVLGLLDSGAYTLDPTNFTVVMERDEEAAVPAPRSEERGE